MLFFVTTTCDSGGKKGQYFYHVTKSPTQAQITIARRGCIAWYTRELSDQWSSGDEPCPCTRLQALIDRRFTISVDAWLWWAQLINSWYGYEYARTGDLSEWNYEEGDSA